MMFALFIPYRCCCIPYQPAPCKIRDVIRFVMWSICKNKCLPPMAKFKFFKHILLLALLQDPQCIHEYLALRPLSYDTHQPTTHSSAFNLSCLLLINFNKRTRTFLHLQPDIFLRMYQD